MEVNKNKGFTLIELMVVMAIIAVLAAILVPQVQNFVSRSRDSRRVADMVEIANAIQQFKMEDGAVPNDDDGVDSCENIIGVRGGIDTAIASVIGQLPPADPLYDSNPGTYFYSFEWAHCSNIIGYGPSGYAAPLSFHRAETDTVELKRETTCGGCADVDNSDYVDIILW